MLLKLTNRDNAYWVARVQNLIRENATDREDGHMDVDLPKWIHQLVDEVITGLPAEGGYDGNMRTAVTLSLILSLWYNQLHYAKARDPHRPAFTRQMADQKRLEYVHAMLDNLVNFSQAPTFFPSQPWEDPWMPSVTSGDFL